MRSTITPDGTSFSALDVYNLLTVLTVLLQRLYRPEITRGGYHCNFVTPTPHQTAPHQPASAAHSDEDMSRSRLAGKGEPRSPRSRPQSRTGAESQQSFLESTLNHPLTTDGTSFSALHVHSFCQ